MLGNPPEVLDVVDLILLRVAKWKRLKLKPAEDSSVFYEEFFTDADDRLFNSGHDRRKAQRAAVLRRIAHDHVKSGGLVLDVGCGVGDNLMAIGGGHLRRVGLEVSACTLRRAREVLPHEVVLQRASATAIPIASESVDLVMCIEVLEHIDDQHQVLREIRRVLRRGGMLALSVPYRAWFPTYFTHMGHIRHYTRTGLQALLHCHNLDAVSWLPNVPRWHRKADHLYVLCKGATAIRNMFGAKVVPHELRLPLMGRPLHDVLLDRIEPLRVSEEALDYSAMETSTFALCVKRE